MIGNESIWRDYEKLETMGQGVYGKVYKARSKLSGEIVAIKKTAYDPEGIAPSTLREIGMLKRIRNHVNVVKLQHIFRFASKNSDELNIFLVMEYADIDLQRYLANFPTGMQLDEVRNFTHQILLGLEHCHFRGVIHRDLKPSNILVCRDLTIKIVDFGLSRRMYFPIGPLSPNTVTQIYRPPEIFLESRSYPLTVDIWSLGCIFAEMFRGRPLFNVENNSSFAVLAEINRKLGLPCVTDIQYTPGITFNFVETPPEVSLESLIPGCDCLGLDLLSKMLKYDPYKRILATSALKHEFFFNCGEIKSERMYQF